MAIDSKVYIAQGKDLIEAINEDDLFSEDRYKTYWGAIEIENIDNHEKYVKVENYEIESRQMFNSVFVRIQFVNCRFKELRLVGCGFEYCSFINCEFENCAGLDLTFMDCHFNGTKLEEIRGYHIDFLGCLIVACTLNRFSISSRLNFLYTDFKNVRIAESSIDDLQIRGSSSEIGNLILINCFLSRMTLERGDFTNTIFERCSIIESKIINSILSTSTFIRNNKTESERYNTIDFHSIINSDNQNQKVLKELFGITLPDVKSYMYGVINEPVFQSIFISYSFKDKVIAKNIRSYLMMHGISTFLWEEDAPGGKRMKTIMSENIKKYDRVLFIASENSIKSEACQYELTEARKKQEESWDEVYYTIHIDNYLFEVTKESIPRKNREEYWENIENLKEIHSINFSEFNKEDFDRQKFDDRINKLAKDIRK